MISQISPQTSAEISVLVSPANETTCFLLSALWFIFTFSKMEHRFNLYFALISGMWHHMEQVSWLLRLHLLCVTHLSAAADLHLLFETAEQDHHPH